MNSQGDCCGGSRERADAERREEASVQVHKDKKESDKIGSLPANKSAPVPTSTELPSPKARHGSCCG